MLGQPQLMVRLPSVRFSSVRSMVFFQSNRLDFQTLPPTQPFNVNNQQPPRSGYQPPGAYQAPNQPVNRQNRMPTEHMDNIIQCALPIHPNTPAGQALYNAQIVQWNTKYAGHQVSEIQPYPLSPGTAPVASGECWKCGIDDVYFIPPTN
jgi:hypothetical protein